MCSLVIRVVVIQREQVDAVWPGWGHASENPKLPNTLKSKGIKFIGPTGPVMSVLGDKIGANILAQTAKVCRRHNRCSCRIAYGSSAYSFIATYSTRLN
jgi:biotin carboxylase